MAPTEIYKRYGLIGYPLSHSFSPNWFNTYFKENHLPGHLYELFPLSSPALIHDLINRYDQLHGLNVTIPYKQSIIPYLDCLTPRATAIGAVNTIKIIRTNHTTKLIGHNTDVDGFGYLLDCYLKPKLIETQYPSKKTYAMVLGSGGASKAVQYTLRQYGIEYSVISRNPIHQTELSYSDFRNIAPHNYNLVINTTPLGTVGELEKLKPEIAYEKLSSHHHLIDLVYNPAITPFLKAGLAAGATASNGKGMLIKQAEKAWDFWNS